MILMSLNGVSVFRTIRAKLAPLPTLRSRLNHHDALTSLVSVDQSILIVIQVAARNLVQSKH
jgi:hypothetical protein